MRQKRRRCWKILAAGMMLAVMLLTNGVGACLAAEEAPEAEQAVKPANLNAEGYDVVILADNSGSVWSQQEERDKALRGIANLAVGSDIRIGGVYFGEKSSKTLGLTSMADEENSTKVMDFLNMTEKDEHNRGTNLGNALKEAQKLLENQDKNRQQIIILFSDGINENLAQDVSFKAAADSETLEQAKALEEKGIWLYCVYLQKERNDEEYLRQLVNYFNGDNNYDEERFKKVEENQISLLSDQFAQTFYSMQNDMKFRDISMDSSGTMTFYIPELGVRRLQIYLKNNQAYEVRLSGPSDNPGIVKSWGDNGNVYITVDEPEKGDWTLEITGEGAGTVTGTLACYTSISAFAELTGNMDEEGNAYLNQPQNIRLSFFDEEGKEFQPDPAAEISASVNLKPETGEKISETVSFSALDSGYESSDFTFREYGTYSYEVNLTYEDFIDLRYEFPGGTVQGQGPVVNDQNGVFMGHGTEKGQAFTFEASDLYSDPDGEKVKVVSYTQINENNPVVDVSDHSGFITVTTEKAGDVEFALNLEDESGHTESVTVKGNVMDIIVLRAAAIVAVVLVIAAVYMTVRKKRKCKQLNDEMESEKGRLDKNYSAVRTVYSGYKEKKPDSAEMEAELKNLSESFEELCEGKFDAELMKYYGVADVVKEDFADRQIEDLKAQEKAIEQENKGCTALYDKGRLRAGRTPNKENCGGVKDYADKLEKSAEKMAGMAEKYTETQEEIRLKISELSNKYAELMEMCAVQIRCSLIVQWDQYIGSKGCMHSGEFIEGYYRLDDVEMICGNGTRTLSRVMGNEKTGIYVHGCEYEGEDALLLRGIKEFQFKNAADGGTPSKVREAVLVRGENYRIRPDDRIGYIEIQVK